jgi:hypothetical protein
VVIENADGALTFRNAGARRIGYSDTLWYGSDHFSPCHHLEGLRAVVRYKANEDQTVAGDWVELELREDLPEFDGKKSETAASKKE